MEAHPTGGPDPLDLRAEVILFDLDGTLVDSTAVVDRCWHEIATIMGRDPAGVVGRYHGIPSAAAIRMIDPGLPERRLRELAQRMAELELSDSEGIVAMPGAPRLLPELPPDRWAVVTSASRELARLRLDAAGLPQPAVLVGADEVARGKPAPDPYLLGARRTGTEPERCLAVEDAPAGVASARAAGCAVLGLLTTHAELDAPCVGDLAQVAVTVVPDGLVLRRLPSA